PAAGMEPLWSPVVANGGNRRQIEESRKPQKQAKTVATGCHPLPENFHGKECDEGGPPAESCSARPRETKGGPTQCCTPDWISAASVSISACSISWARRSRSALCRPTLTVFAALRLASLVSPSQCGRRCSR